MTLNMGSVRVGKETYPIVSLRLIETGLEIVAEGFAPVPKFPGGVARLFTDDGYPVQFVEMRKRPAVLHAIKPTVAGDRLTFTWELTFHQMKHR